MASATEPGRPARHPAAIVAVLGFGGLTASFMQTVLIPIQSALPELLSAEATDTAWAITVTLLAGAISTPIVGRLGDMYGKPRMAQIVLGSLVVGSLLAAATTSLSWLIAGRALQGIGMGIVPLGVSILRDHLPPNRVGSGVALVSATLGVGGALGLPLSAAITELGHWRWLFWMTGAVGLLAMAGVRWALPGKSGGTGGRFDALGAVGLAIGLCAILLVISRGTSWGWASSTTLGLLGFGAVTLAVWGWYQWRVRAPLVDLRVSASRPVLLTNLASIAMGFALFSQNIVFPQLLAMPTAAGGLGLDLLPASLVLMPSGLAMLAMSPVTGWGERRWGARPMLILGAVILAAAYLAAATLPATLATLLAVNVLLGIGVGLGFAAMPSLIMTFVPITETAAANGLNTLMRMLGTSSASALVAAVLASSTEMVDGVAAPSESGLTSALLLGTGAAVVCAALAIAVPARARPATAN